MGNVNCLWGGILSQNNFNMNDIFYALCYGVISSLRLTPVNFNQKSYGSRAFAVSAPELWNKLPDDIRSSDDLNLFKRKLETRLFKKIF